MKVITLYFENKQEYKRMVNVLEYSCNKLNLDLIILSRPKFNFNNKHSKETQYWKNNNVLKMIAWANYFNQLENGETALFIDSDTFIKKDISDVFNEDFDIAYTTDEKDYINTGVMFFKVSIQTRNFVNYWKDACLKMYEDPILWEEWNKKLVGLTQPSFLFTLEKIKIKELKLSRHIYNCIPKSKYDFKDVKIGHMQEPYWEAVLSKSDKLNLNMDYVNYWRELENEKTSWKESY